MKSAKGSKSSSDIATGKSAKTFGMAPKPGGSTSNPGGKHLAGKGDTAYGKKGATC